MDLGGGGGGECLAGAEGGETIVSIYYMEKTFLIRKRMYPDSHNPFLHAPFKNHGSFLDHP